MEDRTKEVESKLKAIHALKKKNETEAYINPELAEKARLEGNEFFKEGGIENLRKAIEKYTEALAADPGHATFNSKVFFNRALVHHRGGGHRLRRVPPSRRSARRQPRMGGRRAVPSSRGARDVALPLRGPRRRRADAVRPF